MVGGIHGENRLGGNALTEALVFGRVAAKSIVAQLGARQQRQALEAQPKNAVGGSNVGGEDRAADRVVTRKELESHVDDAWVLLGDTVYDLSEFVVR